MKLIHLLTPVLISISLSSCYKETVITYGEGLPDWTLETHSGLASPNYEVVFPAQKVNSFIITIAEEKWEDMQSDLNDLFGTSSGRPGESNFPDETPIYVPCNLNFNGKNWYNVGIRYKGNSSLQASAQGEQKLPFRLEFDQFEDDFPEITNQTFYGFPALSMSSNYNDLSFMREYTANQLFAESGVPSPSASFYEMYIDYGEGPVYFGLYTAVEVVFETMLNKEFGSDYGNCYKPEDDGAQFASIGFNLSDFENKTTGGTGEDEITELHEILHSLERTSDEEAWKEKIEKIFDVNGFLKWLAVNTSIQNWDTYGRMSHNYYLYHDPADDLIKWIPWDNNEAFERGKREGALDFNFSNLNGQEWPLIDLLIAVDEYEQIYKAHILDFVDGPFDASKMQDFYDETSTLISSSVEKETSDYSFLRNFEEYTNAVTTLKNHVLARNTAAEAYAR